MGRFVVDFYCPAHRLAVEIDGSAHETRQRYDAERERWLASSGLRVLRFSTADVEEHLPLVLERLRVALSESAPSPLVGEGAHGRRA